MSEPTVVCVLGMHRSGTSLVARVLNVLGVDLGPEEHLMRPSSANPTGHWENKPITGINDEILSDSGAAGSTRRARRRMGAVGRSSRSPGSRRAN